MVQAKRHNTQIGVSAIQEILGAKGYYDANEALVVTNNSINKNEHDRLIFNIVNSFNIRHNRADQKNDYSKEIWYDWMMQYYTSVIIAYYKLKKEKQSLLTT